MHELGRTRWAIPEGFLPERNGASGRERLDARRAETTLLSTIAFAGV